VNLDKEVNLINSSLEKKIPEENEFNRTLIKSIKYSLLDDNSKRIRPIILLKFYNIISKNEMNLAINFACALEMIHTYSLIHDDLPCMDNSNMRRNRPSNHVVFGERIATLAGDALLNLAFETALSAENLKYFNCEKVVKAARILSDYAGINGMIGGQIMDLESENKRISKENLEEMCMKKTGKLIVAAAAMGCVLADATDKQVHHACTYAANLSMSFQIIDDILDYNSDNKKPNYVSLIGLEKSKKAAEEFTEQAVKSLENFAEDMSFFIKLALKLKDRVF